jgi:hypothetical protein
MERSEQIHELRPLVLQDRKVRSTLVMPSQFPSDKFRSHLEPLLSRAPLKSRAKVSGRGLEISAITRFLNRIDDAVRLGWIKKIDQIDRGRNEEDPGPVLRPFPHEDRNGP